MKEKLLKDYFSFTRKERIAVVCLVFLMIALFVVPRLVPDPQPVKLTPEQILAYQPAVVKDAHDDSSANRNDRPGNNTGHYHKPASGVATLFYFDPNELPASGWEKLGLRPKTIGTIQHYLSKGGRFRSAEDLAKIYGLHNDEVQRLMPFVRIRQQATRYSPEHGDGEPVRDRAHPEKAEPGAGSVIDINTADTTALIALPGIGSRLAARIIHFRETLGGFYSVEQVGEVYGLPDSTFKKIKPRFLVFGPSLKYININAADQTALKAHPYIRWNVAKAIVEYRLQHGDFKQPQDLLKIDCIDSGLFKKMAPYLKM